MDADTIKKLKGEHGDELTVLSAGGYDVVVKTPGRAEWGRFKAAQADDRKRVQAAEILFRSCAVHPDAAAVDEMLVKRPGLGDRFALEIMELAGITADVEKKRL